MKPTCNKNERHWLLPTAFLVVLSGNLVAATTETLFTLSDDLKTATRYFSNRTDKPSDRRFIFPEKFDQSTISYARPANFHWSIENTKGETRSVLNFPNTASYAYLQRLSDNSIFLTASKDEPDRFVLRVDGSQCATEKCVQDESIISVIIPSRLKIINYGAYVDNRWLPKEKGQWRVIDNTYTFYRTRLKGASLEFYFEDKTAKSLNQVSRSFINDKEIAVSSEGNLIRVVMPIDNLFDSGSALMKKPGIKWIDTLLETLATLDYSELRVEGHTDSDPVRKRTKHGYTNNWDLSLARASNIVQYLIGKNIPKEKLAAVGYADARPVASNDNAQNKEKNRRLEFSIIISTSDTPQTLPHQEKFSPPDQQHLSPPQ